MSSLGRNCSGTYSHAYPVSNTARFGDNDIKLDVAFSRGEIDAAAASFYGVIRPGNRYAAAPIRRTERNRPAARRNHRRGTAARPGERGSESRTRTTGSRRLPTPGAAAGR